MRRLLAPILCLFALLLTGCSVVADFDGCRFTDDLSGTLEAREAQVLRVTAGAGSLRIQGKPGMTEVQARGEACASTLDLLDQIELTTEMRGEEAWVKAEMPNMVQGYAGLDLTITVPEGLRVIVTDGSGEVEIRNVAGVDLEDASGSVEIEAVAGDVVVNDGSGDIDIRAVNGQVRLTDGSGSIRLSAANGDVTVEEDGSGDIDIADVSGSVRIRSDGSGSIWVRNVKGDFRVDADGSGSLNYSEVGGRVQVPSR